MARSFLTPIALPADPVSPLQAATKQYADTKTSKTTVRQVSAATTAIVGELLQVNAAGAPITVSPPASPSVGDSVMIEKTDITGNVVTFNATVNNDTSAVFVSPGAAATLIYLGSAAWALASVNVSSPSPGAGLTAAQVAATYAPLASPTFTGAVTFTGARVDSPVTLTDGATIAVNAGLGNLFRVALGGSRTLAVPTGGIDGQMLRVQVSAAAAQTLTFNASYLLTTGITSTLSIPAGKRAFIGLEYISAVGWFVTAATVQS